MPAVNTMVKAGDEVTAVYYLYNTQLSSLIVKICLWQTYNGIINY